MSMMMRSADAAVQPVAVGFRAVLA